MLAPDRHALLPGTSCVFARRSARGLADDKRLAIIACALGSSLNPPGKRARWRAVQLTPATAFPATMQADLFSFSGVPRKREPTRQGLPAPRGGLLELSVAAAKILLAKYPASTAPLLAPWLLPMGEQLSQEATYRCPLPNRFLLGYEELRIFCTLARDPAPATRAYTFDEQKPCIPQGAGLGCMPQGGTRSGRWGMGYKWSRTHIRPTLSLSTLSVALRSRVHVNAAPPPTPPTLSGGTCNAGFFSVSHEPASPWPVAFDSSPGTKVGCLFVGTCTGDSHSTRRGG